MKYCYFFILFFSVICLAQTEISGEMSGTLEVCDSPYYVVGDISITPGNELTIEAGCELIFLGPYVIFCYGNTSLICQGTYEDSIIFTCPDSLPATDEVRYKGIVTLDPNFVHFEYCVFENVVSSSNSVLYVHDYDSLCISNCRFNNNISYGTGIKLASLTFIGEELHLRNCIFNNNYGRNAGAVICINELTVDSCKFINNESAENAGAILIDEYYSCSISHSEFMGNNAALNGGAVYLNSVTTPNQPVNIDKSVFALNTALENGGAIQLDDNISEVNIENCVFCANDASLGGAIYSTDSLDTFTFNSISCTFYNNNAESGLAVYNNGLVTEGFVMNSIFFSDVLESNYLVGADTTTENLSFVNCLLLSSHFTNIEDAYFFGCFYRDPEFRDPDYSDGEFDLRLTLGSYCIDRGRYAFGDSIIQYACSDDINFVSRPSLHGFDIGAYEFPGRYYNSPPVIDCPEDFSSFFCEYDTLYIGVSDLYISSLEFACLDSNYYIDEYDTPHGINDTIIRLIPNSHNFNPAGREIPIVAYDGELADTCYFIYDCIPILNDSLECDVIDVVINVGSRTDTVFYNFHGNSTGGTTNILLSDLDEFIVYDSLVTVDRYYDYTISFTADETMIGEYSGRISFYDGYRFRCIELNIVVEEILNYPPEFYGCPDTLVILMPGEITFVYLQIEDFEGDSFEIELVEYPEPFEGFWNYREELIGDVNHIYFQFYPSYEDTGMHIFRFVADDGMDESECIIFTYVTKDTTQLCPYVEPDTVFIEYLEGEPELGEMTIFDYYEIHHWHVEDDCDSLVCVYPQFGVGTETSVVIPECYDNSMNLVFLIDDTGSMGMAISRVTENLSSLISLMDSAMIDVEYGLCTFKDDVTLHDMDTYLPGMNLTPSADRMIELLSGLHASGGGDGPEVCLDAIAETINNYELSYGSYKHFVLFTDYRFHYRGDGTSYSNYIPEEIDSMLLEHGIVLSVVYCSGWRPRPDWFEEAPELTGGNYYDMDIDYDELYSNILYGMNTYYTGTYLSDGTYECNLTYVMDYPVTCRSIDVPVVIHVLDSSETFNTFNCPNDTVQIVTGVCDTVAIDVEYVYCDSPYVNLVEYPIDHVDMWTFENRAGFNRNDVYFIYTPDASDSGLYYYRIEYGNEYGSDTCSFFVRVLGQEPFYHFYEGWNLLSYPFTEPNAELLTLNPDMVRPYTWNASDYTYSLPDEITTADAFWLYSNCEMYYDVHYATISEITTTLYAGWNMVSSVGDTLDIDVLTTHPEVVTPVYYYNTNAGEYETATEILPGIGYWLMSTETFEISYPE